LGIFTVDLYLRVRHAHFEEELSGRQIARDFGISRDSVAKMLAYSQPPGFRRTAPIKRPKPDPLLERFEVELLHLAIKDALQMRAVSFDAIKHLLLCRVERRPPRLDLDVYPFLPRTNIATTAASSYMSLLAGGETRPMYQSCCWPIT